MARAGRKWKWTLKKLPYLETLKNVLTGEKKLCFVKMLR